jgi:glutamine synthetase
MTGKHETSSSDKFTSGVEDRSVAIRIPIDVHIAKKVFVYLKIIFIALFQGYLEDRRPAANCDPYDVMGMLVKTICH